MMIETMVKDDGILVVNFYIPALQRSVRYDRVAGYFRSTSLAAASQGYFLSKGWHTAVVRL